MLSCPREEVVMEENLKMQARGWNTTKHYSHGEERQEEISQVFLEGRDLLDVCKITLALMDGSRTS